MKSKQMICAAAVAGVLVLTSPVYAGPLGGTGSLGGAFGGNLGGSLNSAGGAGRLGGAGRFDSQGDLGGSLNKKPISKSADKVGGKASSGAQGSSGVASAKPTATAPAPAKPSSSTRLSGGADQTVSAAGRSASGGADGSVNAQHSRGSTSTAANGDAGGSLN